MMIGGNTTIKIQIMNGTTTDDIGKHVPNWIDAQTLKGFIDMASGDSPYMTYDAKIQESTHVFLGDYVALASRIKAENSRVIDEHGGIYDVQYIDDPMWLHKQIEIYLKFTGGQYGS